MVQESELPALPHSDAVTAPLGQCEPPADEQVSRTVEYGVRHPHSFTFAVSGKEFHIPKPFLAMHSPVWAARFQAEPKLMRAELPGEAESFIMFVEFLQAQGSNSEVSDNNVLHLLHWGKEFGVEYILPICEQFLLSTPPAGIRPTELLEIAARHNMSLLYSRTTEVVAQGMHWVEVPDGANQAPLSDAFNIGEIREDLISAHISMGVLRNDGEMHRRHRFADHTMLDEKRQRARLLWKTRKRLVPPSGEADEHNWKALQLVWPHHSLRSDDWTVAPHETQPTMLMRSRGTSRGRS